MKLKFITQEPGILNFKSIRNGLIAFMLLFLGLEGFTQSTATLRVTGANWSADATWTLSRTGTITTSTASKTVSAAGGANFLTDISVGQVITNASDVAIGTVASITNATSLELVANALSNNTAIAWKARRVPAATDDVLPNGLTVTVDGNFSCNTVTYINLQGGVTISGTNKLTVAGLVTVSAFGGTAQQPFFNINAGTLSCGSLNIVGGGNGTDIATVTVTTGTLTTGDLTITSSSGAATLNAGSGTINITGNLTMNGVFNAGTGTVNFNGTTQSISGAVTTFNNLVIKANSITSGNALSTVSGVFTIENAGTYILKTSTSTNGAATDIPGATKSFAAGSTIEIQKWGNGTGTSLIALPAGVTWGNLKINITTAMASAWNQAGNLTNIAGTLTVASLGAATQRDFILTATNALTLSVGGIAVTGAALDITSGAAIPVVNLTGNLTISGTGLLKSTGAVSTVNFSKTSGAQLFSSTAAGIANAINWNVGTGSSTNVLHLNSNFTMAANSVMTVLAAATLNSNNYIVNGTTTSFNLNSGGYLWIGSAAGITAAVGTATGNIQTTTSRSFSTGANYYYTGTTTQVTGTGLPATVNILTTNNTGGSTGVTLTNNVTVTGILSFMTGILTTGSNKVSAGAAASISGYDPAKYVNGNLQRNITTATTYAFPVGTSSGYTPVNLVFSSVGSAGDISIASNDGASANYPASLSATKRLNRNWVISNNGVTGFSVNAGLTFLAGDLGGGVTTGELKAYRADPGVVYSYPAPSDYSISGTTFNYNNITGFSSTAGFTVIGAGSDACSAFTATFTKTMASSCGGGSDGTITVTANNATAPVTYSWTSTPAGFTASTAAITGLDSRDYTVVVSDGAGCSVTIPDITIWQAQTPVVTNNGGNSGSCNASGYIILYGSYGIAPFTYSIDGVNYFASNTFNNVAAGTYTGYVKDLRGCVGSKPNIVIGAAAPLGLTYLAKASSSCVNDGSIELYRSGGIGPYTFSLDNITYQSNFKFTNLAAGTYTGWLKDSKGCTVSVANIVVASTAAVTATAGKTNASACLNDGTIQLRGAGGVPGYTYSLNDVTYQSSPSFTGLAAGNYTGWVKDTKGCKGSVLVSITSNTIVVTAYAAGASGCINDGSIQLFRTGGVGPYTYSLDDVTYQSSNTFTGLTGGTYTGWVKDSKGCKGSLGGIVITQVPVTATAGFTNTSTCATNGTIQLRPAGGQAPYTFSLDDVTYQGSNTFTGLAAGSYTGWVKDSKGCKGSVNVNVGTTTLSVTAFPTNASSCVASDGSIMLGRAGGFGPYTYSLGGVTYQSGNVFSGLAPGTYDGYIKDSKNCIAVASNIVVGPSCPPPVTIMTKVDGSSAGANSAEAIQFRAYPNPSATEFILVLDGDQVVKSKVIVTDMMGRIVYQAEGTAKQYRFGKNFVAGIYMVQVSRGSKKQHTRLIKE